MPKIVTPEDPKRDHAVSIFTAAYNGLELSEDRKQRINMRGNELKVGIDKLLRELAAEGRILSIARQVDMLIKGGYHARQSMSEADYRALWGTEVEQPSEYIGRLDLPFLVDDTMSAENTAACNANLYLGVHPDKCITAIPHPLHPENGARLTRWVEFIQLGCYINHCVEDVDALLSADEVGLTPTEGVHLPGQCEKHLRKYAVDLCGSRYGTMGAPCVYWFDCDRPVLRAGDVGYRYPHYGSGSRGIRVVPVSW